MKFRVFSVRALSAILPISPVRFDQSLLHVQKQNGASTGGSSGGTNQKVEVEEVQPYTFYMNLYM